ncbi:hypothetical protein IV73_GL000960 [Weissella kandleri]|uniref:ATP-grasp domain-containing protein n=1 Tax=Weissella kandleri TaxID=1616 RepID=A0A0R2JCY9_9LACO|nr:ATP-grasp domain-containing protein [Weissella kandleri]KRN75198.1 hypothetical protein IV73_GL000960 [Weissella kandleri]
MEVLPGSVIGLIGLNQTNQQLMQAAHNMGFTVALYVEKESETKQGEADYLMVGPDTWESFVGLATIVVYNQAWLSDRVMDKLGEANLPQGTALLDLTRDYSLSRSFFEENAINIVPYKLASTLDEVALAAGSLGYPVAVKSIFKTNPMPKQYVIQGAYEIGLVAPLIDGGQLIVENWLENAQPLMVSAVRDTRGNLIQYPLLEMRAQPTQQWNLATEVDEEMRVTIQETVADLANKIDYVGGFDVQFLATPEGNLYVDDLVPGINVGEYLSKYTSNFDLATQTIRALTGQALFPIEVGNYAIYRELSVEQLDVLYAQWGIRPNWQTTLYAEPTRQGTVGNVVVSGDTPAELQTQLDFSGVWQPLDAANQEAKAK